MQTRTRPNVGFTIVELLIVIVVIAILATISIVAYNGIQNRARTSALTTDLVTADKKLETYRLTVNPGAEQYPTTLALAGVTDSSQTTFTYIPNLTSKSYCLSGVNANGDTYVMNSMLTSPQTGTCAVTSGLVAQWMMDGNANDASGNGNTGTVTGASLTTGQDGSANSGYSFNGTSNYIAIATTSSLNLTANFTVCAWVKPDASIGASGTWNYILAGATNDFGVGIQPDTTGLGHIRYGKIGTSDAVVSTNPMSATIWHSVCTTYASGAITYYLDGKAEGSTSLVSALTAGTKRIGSSTAGAGFFKGAMDDVRVYNRVLGETEVTAIYGSGAQ